MRSIMSSSQQAYPTGESGYTPLSQISASQGSPRKEQLASNQGSAQSWVGEGTSSGKPMSEEGSDWDIIQFAAPIFFASEDDRRAEIDVMRLGRMKGRVTATYTTEDGSAHADVKYKHQAGTVVFEDGEYSKTIIVQLIDDEMWSPTLEFKVHLSEPKNCELGASLYTARVKIIDDDCFPSNEFRNLIGPGRNVDDGLEHIPTRSLFWNYIHWNFSTSGIRWRTLVYISLDQLHNAYLYFKMWATIFIVDTLFNDNVPESNLFMGSRIATSWVLAMGYIMPMVILHLWDNWKTRLDIGGTTCALLQQSLFRKYLNYSEDSRLAVQSSDVHFGILEDCKTASEGYVTILDMVRTVSKFMILMYFVLQENPGAIMYVVAMPMLMLFFACCCQGALSGIEEEVGHSTADTVTLIQEVCAKYRLIADYAQRPKMNEFFECKSKNLRDAQAKHVSVVNNLNLIPVWIGAIFTGMYIALTSKYVGHTLKSGVFVATISIIGDIADDFTDLYSKVTLMKSTTDSIHSLTRLLNLPTDLKLWKSVNGKRMARTLQIRDEIFKGTSPLLDNCDESVQFKTDLIQLELKHMSYEYPDSDEGLVLRDVTLSVPQGRLVAVVGAHGCGKATLLNLLGQCIFPTEGSIFVPTHLRILHITQEPILLDVSAFHNLTFGGTNLRDTSPQRIRGILKRLEMEFLESLVEKDLQHWEQSLTKDKDDFSSQALVANTRERSHASLLTSPYSQHGLGKETSSASTSCHTPRSELGSLLQQSIDDVHLRSPSWFSKLTHTEMVKVHLARALIMNPEIIVCHRPFSHFATEKAKIMLSAMKEHVANRGLMLPEDSRPRRRPRTAFYIPENIAEASAADTIWQVDGATETAPGSRVYEISHKMLTHDFRPASGIGVIRAV